MQYLTFKKSSEFLNYNSLLLVAVAFLTLAFFSVVQASVTPILSVSSTGNGDSVMLNVTGDANSNVLFMYTKTGYGQQTTNIGTTNSSGTLTTTISTSSYGITPGTLVRVVMGDISGLESPDVTWPTTSGLLTVNNSNLYLSQTNVTLNLGQTSMIVVNNLNGSSIDLYNNSSPSIANFNINGSQITISANQNGSTTATFCIVNNTSSCGMVYVVVQGGSSQPISFSENSPTVAIGQTQDVNIYGPSGGVFYVASNTNPSTVQANLTGSVLELIGIATGSSTVEVCAASTNNCDTLTTITSSNTTTVPYDCTGALYSISTGVACPASTIVTAPTNTNTTPTTSSTTNTTTTSTAFHFTAYLKLGSSGSEVIQLQEKLKALGFYAGKIDGGFGTVTETAVKAFQKANNISQAGSVGPLTRAALNSD